MTAIFYFSSMNPSINKLNIIAQKPSRLIIGLMSGTSLDGLDISLNRIYNSGLQTKVELLFFETIPYNKSFKEDVLSIFSKKEASIEKLCLLNASIGILHAQMINNALKKWGIKNSDVDAIASHGQTIYHAPKIFHKNANYPNATLQIGDGDHIAVNTGIITISDFRQKNIAACGEGAPLALYGDYVLYSSELENRVLLNIGGIANFTYLPKTNSNEKIICTDTGPGNTLMDAFVRANYHHLECDFNAEIALKGSANLNLLKALSENDYFLKEFPKTTGPETFNLDFLNIVLQKTNITNISNEDILATLNAFSANTIVSALKHNIPHTHYAVYTSGGGIHNPLLIKNIKEQLPQVQFNDTNILQINPDAKESVLFALLANETLHGGTIQFPFGENEKLQHLTMGKISLPN